MKARVTQNDVARAAGVHNSTVSLALRNHASLPEPTCRRIQAIARELGYAPDPALQALVAYRAGRMLHRRQETIAYVTTRPLRELREPSLDGCVFAGARRKAAECGCSLEPFSLEGEMTARRLGTVLYHRGIRGVILANGGMGEAGLDFDWTQFSAVKVAHRDSGAPLHAVMADATGIVRSAVRRVRAAGYQRIGFAVPAEWIDRDEQTWPAAIASEQWRMGGDIPMLVQCAADRRNWRIEPDSVHVQTGSPETWATLHQPDVVVSFGSMIRDQLRPLIANGRIESGYVDLALDSSESTDAAGIFQNLDEVGAAAIGILIRQLQYNERGLPAVPTVTLIEGTWRNGSTLPARAPAELPPRRERAA